MDWGGGGLDILEFRCVCVCEFFLCEGIRGGEVTKGGSSTSKISSRGRILGSVCEREFSFNVIIFFYLKKTHLIQAPPLFQKKCKKIN